MQTWGDRGTRASRSLGDKLQGWAVGAGRGRELGREGKGRELGALHAGGGGGGGACPVSGPAG